MSITSAYLTELARLGIEWHRLRDDHVSGLSRHDLAHEAYLFLLEHPDKTASYAIAAVLATARRRAAMESEMLDEVPDIAVCDDEDNCERHDVPEDVEVAASILRGGTDAAAAVLRCSRRRVQQLLSRDPVALARRLAAARQGELFGEGA